MDPKNTQSQAEKLLDEILLASEQATPLKSARKCMLEVLERGLAEQPAQPVPDGYINFPEGVTRPTPEQESKQPAQQEPYGWKVYGVNSLFMGEFAESDAKAEAKRIGRTCIAFPLYTSPQAPAQQEPVAWRFTGIAGLKRYMTQKQYDALTIGIKKLYEPFKCSHCAAPQPPAQPLTFEQWLAMQHGDPEELGFLQALRIAYIAGQDSITKGGTQ